MKLREPNKFIFGVYLLNKKINVLFTCVFQCSNFSQGTEKTSNTEYTTSFYVCTERTSKASSKYTIFFSVLVVTLASINIDYSSIKFIKIAQASKASYWNRKYFQLCCKSSWHAFIYVMLCCSFVWKRKMNCINWSANHSLACTR